MSLGLIPHRRSRLSPLPGRRDRWDPWRLVGELDRSASFTPRVDVTENEEAYVIQAELPGMEEKDFEVVLQDEVLTLKGQKRDERESTEKGWHRTESSHGRFERRFRFPVEIVADSVSARYRNGILTVTLPKPPEARPQTRTIPIDAA